MEPAKRYDRTGASGRNDCSGRTGGRALRNALSSGAGGAGTVHVHHSTNFSVQAIDASGVRQFFKNNGRQILRTINDGVRTGSHLGLSKIGGAV
ncbi:protein of unknown function [Methylocella tundrae]|uniref:Uncharacterized protein n=1 Tax=Methylocella tundrae TaxID=227605 RepID=A0A4U8Z448_METTU|nr:protein of unknown function [Methylocella tundrae]